MVINNFDIVRTTLGPAEANPELPADLNAVLIVAITMQRLQHIAGRYFKIIQLICSLKLPDLPQGNALEIDKASDAVEVTMTGAHKVHAYCHCEDCRDLLQVPYHSVLAWEADQVEVTKGEGHLKIFQHPTKSMTRIFCGDCGEVLYNTNAMGWKLVSQLLVLKTNGNELPESYKPNAHFFYDRRIIDIDDSLPKR